MARTPLFKEIRRLLQIAVQAENRGISTAQFTEKLMTRQGVSPAEIKMSRREAMKRGAIAAASLTVLAPLLRARPLYGGQTVLSSSDSPIIIIGAGTAGLTAAYRLMRAGIACEIYEGSHRVGGRMYTQRGFNSEGMFCERGGELVDTDHDALISLAKEIGLEIQPIVDTDPGIDKELYFIGGKVYTQAQLLAGFQPLAKRLVADMKTCFGTDLDFTNVPTPTYQDPYRAALFDKRSLSLKDYIYSLTDVDRWVLDLLNICYLGEYGLETEQQSVLNLFTYVGAIATDDVHLLGVSDESHRVAGGNSSLPEKLESLIKDAVPIHREHRWLAVRDTGSKLVLTFEAGAKTLEVNTHQIVSAIPFTILREVHGVFGLDLSPRKKRAIQELGYGTNAKRMIGYKERFWRQPLGGRRPSSGLVYSDTDSQEFWETSRKQTGTSGIVTSFMGGKAGLRAPHAGFESTIAHFGSIFPGPPGMQAKDYFDGHHLLQHWPSYKFTKGSYTCCMPGQYVDLIGSPGEPELGGRFCFAGEHTSIEYSGFMNGAVESGNTVAQYILQQHGIAPSPSPSASLSAVAPT